MKPPATPDPSAERTAVVRIAQSPADAWSGLLRDWFRQNGGNAWQRARSSVVIVPSRPYANALKTRLLEEGFSHLGLFFVTPAVVRELLLPAAGKSLASREDLRLLLAISADETLADNASDSSEDVNQTAKAVVRAPDHLLRTVDRLDAAGWKNDQLQLRSFRPIIQRFQEHLSAADLHLVSQLDRQLLERSRNALPVFSKLLMSGFDGAHWPFWFLLRAAVQSSEDATVLLEYPHGETDADNCWIGSWEEALGEATDVAARVHASADSFFTAEEMRGLGRAKQECKFLIGANTSEQAEAVAQQCEQFLAEPGCTRIGVVFAASGALPRLVANTLARLGIRHYDAIAHPLPGIFETAEWRAWLQLQQGPRINSLLHFINAIPDRSQLLGELSFHAFERTLRSAYGNVLIDDLAVLQKFCAENPDSRSRAVAAAVDSLTFLPARATLREFLRQTQAAFEHLRWKIHWLEISCRFADWIQRHDCKLSRALFLRWLSEIASTSTAARAAAGEHPYARVQLLVLPQALGQEWSHLIFAGWNEGSWPPPAAGEFARDEEIASFNRSIRKANQEAVQRGRHGEGHTAIREDLSYYLGPSEQRAIALRQFDALANSTAQGIAFSASLAQENAPERFWNPSELFTRFYQQAHREPLTQAAMMALQQATTIWLEHARTLRGRTELPSVQVEQTRVAFNARRDPLAPAGEYDFAFRSSPAHVPILSVTEIEKLVSTPALIWMKRYLGVEAADEGGAPWQAATGQWVHHWLARIGGVEGSRVFARLPSSAEIDQCVRNAAAQKQEQVERLCAAAGKTLPDWWTSGWQNALHLARHLGSKIPKAEEWPYLATEWTIDGEEPVELLDGGTLSFRGRLDLLLARSVSGVTTGGGDLWILDYKTGSNKPLAPAKEDTEKRKTRLHNRLVKGEAIQLGLYALALRQRGASEVFVSIVSPAVRCATPQLSVGDIAAHDDVFAELARMQETGVFGMYGQLRPAFGYARAYPLATLGIDPDLLDTRWELTHPALAREEEEWDAW